MSITRRASASSRSSMRRSSNKAPPAPSTVSLKCAVLGDGDVGKSTMLLSFLYGRCPADISPGPMDGHSEFDHLTQVPYKMTVDTTEIHITLVDTYGQDEYEKLRDRMCSSADVFILCYDVSKPSTFDRIRHHWLPEIRRYAAPDSPFIVAGLKSDIRTSAAATTATQSETETSRDTDTIQCVSYSKAMKEASELGAGHYVECSAQTRPLDVRRVLEKAVQTALLTGVHSTDLKRTSCSVS